MKKINQILMTTAGAVLMLSAQPVFAAAAPVVVPPMAAFAIDAEGAVLVADANSNSVLRIVEGNDPEVFVGPDSGLYHPNAVGYDGATLFIGDERAIYKIVVSANARTAQPVLKKVQSLVNPGPKVAYVKITAPALLTLAAVGKVVDIRWVHNLGAEARFNVELSRDNGATWETLASDVKGKLFKWTATLPKTSKARLRVTEAPELTPSTRQSAFDMSDDILYVLYPAE